MIEPLPPLAQRWLIRAVCALAGLGGLLYGYAAGDRIGGLLLGVVMALNAAVIASIMVGAVLERLLRLIQPRAARREEA